MGQNARYILKNRQKNNRYVCTRMDNGTEHMGKLTRETADKLIGLAS